MGFVVEMQSGGETDFFIETVFPALKQIFGMGENSLPQIFLIIKCKFAIALRIDLLPDLHLFSLTPVLLLGALENRNRQSEHRLDLVVLAG